MKDIPLGGWLLIAVFVLIFGYGIVWAATAQAAPLDGKGQPNATEEKTSGAPANPDGWGSAVSDIGLTGTMGSHSSSFPTPRLGLGNVARTDGEPGDNLGAHGEFAARMSGGLADATDKPGP